MPGNPAADASSPRSQRGPRRAPPWLLGPLLALGVTLLGLTLLEAALRVAGYRPDTRWVGHPVLHYLPAPHQRYHAPVREPDGTTRQALFSFNRYGQRCPDYALEKEPGEFRLVVLGDSLTMGPGVGDGDLYTTILDELLAARSPQGARVRVVNASANGWSAVHYRRWLESQAEHFDPDLVVVACFIGNDQLVMRIDPLFQRGPMGNLLRRLAIGQLLLERHRPLARWLQERWDGPTPPFLEPLPPELRSLVNVPEHQLREDQKRLLWEHTVDEHFGAMRRLCEERGIALVCLLIPMCRMVIGEDPIYDWLAGRLEEAGVPVLRPLGELRGLGRPAYLDDDEGHLSATGHHATARALLLGLRDGGWLP